MVLSRDYCYRILLTPVEKEEHPNLVIKRQTHVTIYEGMNLAGHTYVGVQDSRIFLEHSRFRSAANEKLCDELEQIASSFPGKIIDFRMYSGNKRGIEIKDTDILPKKPRKSVDNSPNRAS